MAIFRLLVESGGHVLPGALVTVYNEDEDIAEGNEDGSFVDGDKATIYTDRDMTISAGNPLTADSVGEISFHILSLSKVAFHIARAGYGSRWYRWVDVTGSDPV